MEKAKKKSSGSDKNAGKESRESDVDPRIESRRAYDNFVRLHVSWIILLSEILCVPENIHLADEQLQIFVEEFGELYGEEFISHNVHALIHAAKDALKYGPLHSVSALKYENLIGQLVDLVNKPDSAVLQVMRRIHERNLCDLEAEDEEQDENKSDVKFSVKHTRGPLVSGFSDPQFSLMQSKKLSLSLRRPGDCCFMTRSNDIVMAENFASSSDGTVKILGKKFLRRENFYTTPVLSSDLGIWEVSELSTDLQTWDVTDIF